MARAPAVLDDVGLAAAFQHELADGVVVAGGDAGGGAQVTAAEAGQSAHEVDDGGTLEPRTKAEVDRGEAAMRRRQEGLEEAAEVVNVHYSIVVAARGRAETDR